MTKRSGTCERCRLLMHGGAGDGAEEARIRLPRIGAGRACGPRQSSGGGGGSPSSRCHGRRRCGGMKKRGLVAFSIHPLPQELAVATHGLGFLPGLAFGRLLIGTAQLHFPEYAFTLHLLLERFQRLIDIVVAYDYVNDGRYSLVDIRGNNISRRACGTSRSARLIT
jgi:hypothetical protein